MARTKIALQGKLLLLIILMGTLSSCGIFQKGGKRSLTKTESFDAFYSRFHQDPEFQYSRLKFPLEGLHVDGDGETTWTKENWVLMKVRIFDIKDPAYETEYKQTANSFYQKFWGKDSGFFAEYRFELIKGNWYLVYAKDVNL